jgi:hypothetical protein
LKVLARSLSVSPMPRHAIAIAIAAAATITTVFVGSTPVSAGAGPALTVWVSTHGNGVACSKAKPCTLTRGLANLQSTGTLVLEPGHYGSTASPLATTIAAGTGSLIEGEPGKASPVVYSAAANYGFLVGSIAHVHVMYSGSGNGVVASEGIDHVVVITQSPSNPDSACGSLGAPVTDSLCVNESNQGVALTVVASVTPVRVRGVTAIDDVGSGTGILAYEGQPNTTGHVTVTNSIAVGIEDFGGVAAGPPPVGGTDQNISVTCTYADVSEADSTTSGTGSGQVILGKGTVRSAPQFVNTALDDYRELATSPTADTGSRDPAADTDLAGLPRTLGSAPDMGAYELAEKPTVAHVVARTSTKSSVKITVSINPKGLPASVIAVATRGRVSTRSKRLMVTGRKARREVLVITGLKHHTVYRIDVVATNRGGQTTSRTVKATT